ncbi:hypothetical protein [Acinetobacter baumannii]|uniref:hypothetical protein n=1 Tax=Acinetobacter baumannii TaxID=470 RepID=UPI000B14F60E
MAWDVETTELFDSWLAEQDENAQDKILASLLVLSELGPNLAGLMLILLKNQNIRT